MVLAIERPACISFFFLFGAGGNQPINDVVDMI